MGKTQKVGNLSLKGCVGDSRLVPCLWTEITHQNVRNTPIIIVHLIHSREVRRRNLSAKGCLPYDRLPDVCLL
ncbi:MAG: hypothetical protein LBK82_16960 [Planctomycetaceae bacterium]|jgi:hypothetical protein|nr:hypothetical protein [Planctomycetaceae bacterium]